MATVTSSPADLNQRRMNENLRNWLKWLSPDDYFAKQNDLRAEWHDDSGKWLLDDFKFQQWITSQHGILFCHGIPGAGKTIMASIVVDHLFNAFSRNSKAGIAYWYCTPQLRTQKLATVFGSILNQLVRTQVKLPSSMDVMYQEYLDCERRPSHTQIMKVLCDVTESYEQVFIVIDGLDELSGRQHSHQQMINEIFTLQEKTSRVKILVTSRPIPEIMERFEDKTNLCIEITAHEEDLARYVEKNSHRMPDFMRKEKKLLDQAKEQSIQDTEGMFLLVQLRLEALASTTSVAMFQTRLSQFKDEKCEDLYKDTMRRITHKDGLGGDALNVARCALFWVLLSRRELSAREIQHAIAVNHQDCNPVSKEEISDIGFIISLCGGLLRKGVVSENVEFVHSTARKYFEETCSNWFPEAKDKVAKTCLTYLSYPNFTGACRDEDNLKKRLNTYPLYAYAAQNWGHHAGECSDSLMDDIKSFLTSQERIDACSQVMMLFTSNLENLYAPRQMFPPHLVAYFGLDRVAESMELSHHHHINSPDADGRTPLIWAARNGHTKLVTTLLQQPGINLNMQDKDRRSAFWWAAAKGHTAILNEMLESDNIDVYHKDAQKRNALFRAVINGRSEVVQLLLDTCKFDVNHRDAERRTVLWWASAKGYGSILQQLLPICEAKSQNLKDKHGWDPLTRAVYRGHRDAVHVLLTSDALVPDHTSEGHTPWWWAMKNTDITIAEEFIHAHGNRRIDANTVCVGTRTALSWAAGMGVEEIVRQLLNSNPDLNSFEANGRGKPPLSWAAAGGRVSVVELLLETHGVNMNQADTKRRTPLWWAIANNKRKVVELFLEHSAVHLDGRDGVDFNIKDCVGRTPLTFAASLGWSDIVGLLLSLREQLQIDVNSTDEHLRTPISWAARNGHEEVVRQLLEVDGVNPNMEDKLHRTPLMWAIIKGRVQVAETLIMEGRETMNFDKIDQKGRSALFWAAWVGDAATISALSEIQEVNCNIRAISGDSPLSIAIKKGYSQSASRFIKEYRNIDLNALYENGMTLLHLAAQRDDGDTVRLLLERHVELDRSDDFHRTPLFLACGLRGRVKLKWNEEYSSLCWLLDAETNLNHQTEKGWTPLHNACHKGDIAAIKEILKYRADALNWDSDVEAPQPLEIASRYGQLEAVKELLKFSIARRMNLENALRIASAASNTKIQILLQKHITESSMTQDRLVCREEEHMVQMTPSEHDTLTDHDQESFSSYTVNTNVSDEELPVQANRKRWAYFLTEQIALWKDRIKATLARWRRRSTNRRRKASVA